MDSEDRRHRAWSLWRSVIGCCARWPSKIPPCDACFTGCTPPTNYPVHPPRVSVKHTLSTRIQRENRDNIGWGCGRNRTSAKSLTVMGCPCTCTPTPTCTNGGVNVPRKRRRRRGLQRGGRLPLLAMALSPLWLRKYKPRVRVRRPD